MDAHHEGLVELCEARIASDTEDLLVNLPVEPRIGHPLAPPPVADHVGMQGLEAGEVIGGQARAGEFAGQRLQHAHDGEEFLHRLRCDAGDAGATVRREVHEALGGQHLQCLAQRRARDPEEVAEVGLGDLVARLQRAFDDHVAKPPGQLGGKRAAGDQRMLVHADPPCRPSSRP